VREFGDVASFDTHTRTGVYPIQQYPPTNVTMTHQWCWCRCRLAKGGWWMYLLGPRSNVTRPLTQPR